MLYLIKDKENMVTFHDFPKYEIMAHKNAWMVNKIITQTDVQDSYFRSSFTMWKKII